jgi:hypothetical protein
MSSDPGKIIEKIGLNVPILGVYDAPGTSLFEPFWNNLMKSRGLG